MNAAEKGALYARIFRKVGVFLGKGEIPRALKELSEGMKIAELNGDSKMAARFGHRTRMVSFVRFVLCTNVTINNIQLTIY